MTAVQNVTGIAGLGVGVSLTLNDSSLQADKYGFLGKLRPQDRIMICLKRTEDAPVFGLRIDSGKQGPRKVRELPDSAAPGDALFVFEKRILVEPGLGDRQAYTKPGQNALTVAERLGGGLIRLHELAIASHKGEFFLTHQWHNHQVFRGKRPVVPELRRWEFEPGLLEKIVGPDAKLPPQAEFQSMPESTPEGLGRNEACVLFWSDAQGLGAVATPSVRGRIRIHRNHVKREPGQLTSLAAGDVISFNRLERIPPDSVKQQILYQVVGAELLRRHKPE